MGPEAIVTLVGVALIVGALAVYLIVIAYSLYKVSFTLGTVLIGVRAIAARCEPLSGVVGSIANDVGAVERAMERLATGYGRDGDEEYDQAQDYEGAPEYEEYEEAPEYEEAAESEVVEGYEERVEVEAVDKPRRRRRVRR